jgi:hypothetical protein
MTDIPDKFKELLLPNKMQYVLSPGNVGSREVSTRLRYFRLSIGLKILLLQSLKPTL